MKPAPIAHARPYMYLWLAAVSNNLLLLFFEDVSADLLPSLLLLSRAIEDEKKKKGTRIISRTHTLKQTQ